MSNLTVEESDKLDLTTQLGPAFSLTAEIGPSFQLALSTEETFTLNVGTKTSSLFAGGGERGPQGIQGIQGEQGIQGIQGPQGEVGPIGPQGLKGDKGDKGDQGDVGPASTVPGPQGETGPMGPTGPQGAASTVPGPQGIQGPIGPKGDKGDKGDDGVSDIPGPQGEQGPPGPQGIQGNTGATGEKGDRGYSLLSGSSSPTMGTGDVGDFYLNLTSLYLYGPKTASSWGNGRLIKGETGNNGEGILHGTAEPTNVGNTGDFYLRTTDYTLYGPKASGTWPAPVSLRGPQGPKGDDGADSIVPGPAGPQGAPGPKGDKGDKGDDGVSDIPGPQGEQGPAGPQGDPGPAGADGATWHTGSGTPDNAIGEIGDLYLRTGNDTVYEKTGATQWTNLMSIRGSTGNDGQDGVGVPVGGTTGQVLSKTTDADHDTGWIDPPAGTGGGGGGVTAETDFFGLARPFTPFQPSGTGAWWAVPLAAAASDPFGFTGTDRIVIPAGVSKVRFRAMVRPDGAPGDNQWMLYKNGAMFSDPTGFVAEINETSYTNGGESMISATMDVVAGDYFELRYYVSSTIPTYTGFFEVEAVKHSLGNQPLPVKAASLSLTTSTVVTSSGMVLSWDGTKFDDGIWWDVANPTRLTVPAGVTHVSLTAGTKADQVQASTQDYNVVIRKNGVDIANVSTDDHFWGPPVISTGVVDAVEGDYFELYMWSNNNFELNESQTFFNIHAIQGGGSGGGGAAEAPKMTLAEITASRNLLDTDLSGNKFFDVNSASAVVITVPTGLTGTEPVTFQQTGAGALSFAASGVTIQSLDGNLTVAGQFGSATLIPKGSDVYGLVGALTT